MARRRLLCVTAGAAALLLTALAPLATADDGDDLSAQELAKQAKDNLLKADSVRLKLTDHSAGVNMNRTQPTSMDLALDREGNCTGTMRMGADGGSVEIIKQGDEVWMKPDTAFWKSQVPGNQGAAVAELFKGRYIHGSTNDAMLKGLADTCDLNNFQKDIDTGTARGTSLTKGDKTKVDDTDVIPLTGREDGRHVTLYVTSDSPHRLIQATQRGAGANTTLAFTDYDEPVPSETPQAKDTVDVNKLQEELQKVPASP